MLVDTDVLIRPASTQVDDLLGEIHTVVERGERVLVTTLTKKMSEDHSLFLSLCGILINRMKVFTKIEVSKFCHFVFLQKINFCKFFSATSKALTLI